MLQIRYLRHLIVRPVRSVTGISDEIAEGEGDCSRDLPLQTHDEFRRMAESYNRFADKVRQIIGEVRRSTESIARNARFSLGEMQDISARINTVSEKVLRFNHIVEDLSRRSGSVNQFAALIRDVVLHRQSRTLAEASDNGILSTLTAYRHRNAHAQANGARGYARKGRQVRA